MLKSGVGNEGSPLTRSRSFISVAFGFTEVGVVVYRVPTCHHRWKMPTPVPTMPQLSDILPIEHSIGILNLFFDVLISVPHCRLLLLPIDQVLVEGSCFHVLWFQYMVVVKPHETHHESSKTLAISIDM